MPARKPVTYLDRSLGAPGFRPGMDGSARPGCSGPMESEGQAGLGPEPGQPAADASHDLLTRPFQRCHAALSAACSATLLTP